jgi:cytochrome P450
METQASGIFPEVVDFCIGAPLSRLESKIALGILLERFRDIKRDREPPLQRIPAASAFFGVRELPITFKPA